MDPFNSEPLVKKGDVIGNMGIPWKAKNVRAITASCHISEKVLIRYNIGVHLLERNDDDVFVFHKVLAVRPRVRRGAGVVASSIYPNQNSFL